MKRYSLILGAAATLLSLSACGGKEAPAPEPVPEPTPTVEVPEITYGNPVVGTCYEDDRLGSTSEQYAEELGGIAPSAMADDPTYEKKVECTAPHSYEVLKVLDLPDDIGFLPYNQLLDTNSSSYAKLASWANTQCAKDNFPNSAKVSKLLPWKGALMSPTYPLDWTASWNITEPESFSRSAQVVCLMNNEGGKSLPAEELLTNAVPATERICYNEAATTFNGCDVRHDYERFASINWLPIYDPANVMPKHDGRENVPRFDRDVQDALYASCNAYLKALGTKTPVFIRLVAYTNEWPAPDGSYTIYCETSITDVRGSEDDLKPTAGSVYDLVKSSLPKTPAPASPSSEAPAPAKS